MDSPHPEAHSEAFSPSFDPLHALSPAVSVPEASEPPSSPSLPSPAPSVMLQYYPIFMKGARGVSTSVKRKSASEANVQPAKKRAKPDERVGGPVGLSKSAQASRAVRLQVSSGNFVWSETKLKNWKWKIWKIDDNAVLHDDNMHVRCSKCGQWWKIKEPYEAYRYRTHFTSCKQTGAPTLQQLSEWFEWSFKRVPDTSPPKDSLAAAPNYHPCCGVSPEDDERIGTYLRRTGAVGGGGRSIVVIAKEKLSKTFSELTRQQKQAVIDAQISEHKWWNDFGERASMPRTASVKIDSFRRAIDKPIPTDKNYVFVNRFYRDPVLGELYAKTVGLRDLINPEHKTSPFIRYTQGVLKGKYSDGKLLGGLLESVMIKEDKERRGVGMQNFRWPVDYDRFLHLVFIDSPRAYRALSRYLPARTERSFRAIESEQPSIPFTITERTFQLVQEHIRALDYNGYLVLSCDNSKLLPALRLYYDDGELAMLSGRDGSGCRRCEGDRAP
ncbi:hypothetical protein BN946_scf184719.g3 [Trametes cinnabarina]|uniref:Uncharacterized protein n=1 Tax=Pycnoporus cinnabarinus TaxID=5643 RepID=A0A060SVF7_PYCCI|nr:hypothetical protein BN946_scf184719.g3 [Trametes cinnabarina]